MIKMPLDINLNVTIEHIFMFVALYGLIYLELKSQKVIRNILSILERINDRLNNGHH